MFVAHLVNQLVAQELITLELLTLLLENPTEDGVEVAVAFVAECSSVLQDLSPKGLHGSDEVSDDKSSQKDEDGEQMTIADETETNLVSLRRKIYLTIMLSVDFEEAGHKLLQLKPEPGEEVW
ncbi:putative MIF4G-like domain superfamily protein [Helianthus anomalus]